MGFRFRKSAKIGPVRLNYSKSGIGWSIGGKGARFTKKANGGYRTTVGIPNTGISYSKDYAPKQTHNVSSAKRFDSVPVAHSVSPERRAKEQKVGIAMGLFFIIVIIVIVFWKLFGSANIFAPNAVYTTVIPKEAVWDAGSTIQFSKYPGNCRPGDNVLLEIDAAPDTYYSVLVYADFGVTASNSLVGTDTNATGKADWSWEIPNQTAPGIYYIQVSDRAGNKNCIDYNVVALDGSVVGNPPSREPADTETNTGLAIEIEDSFPTAEQSQIVYVTESGEKYHKATCHHVSSGSTAIDINTAIARGYTACQSCY